MWLCVKRNVVICMRYICSRDIIYMYMNFSVYFQYIVAS